MSIQNTTPAAQPATLADFIAGEEGDRFLSSAEYTLADTHCDGIADHLIGELEHRAGKLDAAETALSAACDIADNLESAAADIRHFIRRYFEQSGAIERAELAITTFCEAPTAANRAALMQAVEIFGCNDVPMEAKLARSIRPFIRLRRFSANKINFGNLRWLMNSYIREELIVREAA
jgi:hypothetical protein